MKGNCFQIQHAEEFFTTTQCLAGVQVFVRLFRVISLGIKFSFIFCKMYSSQNVFPSPQSPIETELQDRLVSKCLGF